MNLKKFCCIFVLLITGSQFFTSCKNTSSPEQNAFDSICSSLKFKSYKTLSENTIPPIILVYNSTLHQDEIKISEGIVRLLIGYSWAVNDKPEYAIAESIIIKDLAKNDKDVKILLHSLSAIALYEKKLNTLADEESKNAIDFINKTPDDNSTEIKKVCYHLLLGTLCVYEQNIQGARFHFAAFNTITKIEWPYLLADALADIHENNATKGLKKIKLLSKDKSIPKDVRNSLTESLKKNEGKTKDIDITLFWTKTISQSVYNSIKTSNIKSIEKVSELIENIKNKLSLP
ncbi:MAG TPA: hypothetical protein PKK00_08255 [Bacteroidales bacterium]|nr:hypothetical protein [Bacteroidales bacterium]HPS17225.1 hypothetical protein [Bacteroidales bacterium]